ncbi:hypothetical protein [Actinoplanes sp. NPDC026623]|uniref:hypothetical protein n=1 Tax=Actinoplanes sp. NPDC026623 TaxID=3155610 RepID=UPI0033CF505B
MRCEICGTPLERPGQAHTCRTGLPVPGPAAETFALAGRRVVRFAVAYAVIVVIANVLAYAVLRDGVKAGGELDSQASVLATSSIAIVSLGLGLVALVCVIGLLVSAVVWIISAHRVTNAGPGLAGYGGLIAGVLLIGSAWALPSQAPTLIGAAVTEAALRIGGIVVLVAGVLLVRARVGRETGTAEPVGKPTLVTSADWDASTWDPEVLRDIDRKRGANPAAD